MSDASETTPNVEALTEQLEELKKILKLSDDELKAHLIADLEETFSSPESIKSLRTTYEETFKKLEGMLLFLEGLSKMAVGLEKTKPFDFADLDTITKIFSPSDDKA